MRRTKAYVYVLYYNHIQTNSVNNDKETIIKVLEYILDTCMVSIINNVSCYCVCNQLPKIYKLDTVVQHIYYLGWYIACSHVPNCLPIHTNEQNCVNFLALS